VMDELVAKFLPRFGTLARERLRRALDSASSRRHESAPDIIHDMHALAGEAGLLGLERVTGVARTAEAAAKRYRDSRADGDAAGLVACLERLSTEVSEALAETAS
jgi:HPt (histidine-containing phosphotransfer) domain-containing protein